MTVSHAAGFVHRDLKPENIFLVGDGRQSLQRQSLGLRDREVACLRSGSTDFDRGAARDVRVHEPRAGHRRRGRHALRFVEPRRAGIRGADWHLSVQSRIDGGRAVCGLPRSNRVPSDLARVPPGFDAWFARAVQRDPDQRFQTAKQLAAELQPVLDAPASGWLGNDPRASARGRADAAGRCLGQVPVRAASGRARDPSSIPAAIDGQRDLRNTALIYNTSRSGALLATRRSWACEQAITLTLHLDSAYDGETVLAHIVRVTARDAGLWKFDVAVRFAEPLAEEVLARIEARARARG